jgi:hypothetical protein
MPSVEITIKRWDLISAKGYFQSNHGRWRTSGRPATPDRVAAAWCGRRGSVVADAARAHRSSVLQAMVLHFWWFLFLRNRWGVRNSPRGSSTGGGLWSRTCNGKVQASTFGDGGGRGCSKGRLTRRLGKTGAAQDVEHRRRVDGAREASYAAWRWKGQT